MGTATVCPPCEKATIRLGFSGTLQGRLEDGRGGGPIVLACSFMCYSYSSMVLELEIGI